MPITSRVPLVDLTQSFGPSAERDSVVDTIRRACEEVGFLVITGHGVERQAIADVESASREFFALALEAKMRSTSDRPGVYRGYRPAEGAALARSRGIETPPDLCEAYSVSRFDDREAALRAGLKEGREGFFAANIWPPSPRGFREAFERYYAALEDLAAHLMGLMAIALGLDEHWFDDKIADHITNLTVNYYPTTDGHVLPGQFRRGEHTDWGSLTILYSDGEPGLQIRSPAGEWEDVAAVPDSFIVNLGDLMAAWTNDTWTSTLHRVVADPGEASDRLSIAFFHQPAYDAVIECIPTCTSATDPPRHPPMTSGEWILSMLEKITY